MLGIFIAIPVCFAGGALTIVQDEKQLAPRGSYIPERRVSQVLRKVEQHQKMLQKETETKSDGAEPESSEEK
jgi:hypothetical protein